MAGLCNNILNQSPASRPGLRYRTQRSRLSSILLEGYPGIGQVASRRCRHVEHALIAQQYYTENLRHSALAAIGNELGMQYLVQFEGRPSGKARQFTW